MKPATVDPKSTAHGAEIRRIDTGHGEIEVEIFEKGGKQQVFIAGDKDLLFDALANLVDNAIKHGHTGGQVTVEVNDNEGEAIISVGDNGPGIPLAEHRNVFKRFFRLERSRHTPGNGLAAQPCRRCRPSPSGAY